MSWLLRPTWSLLGVAVALSVALAGWGAWSVRGNVEELKQLRAASAAAKLLKDERLRGDGLAAELEAERRNIKTVTVEVIRYVPSVTTVYVEKPGDAPKPIPDAVFTRGFVGLWNHALAAGVRTATSGPADPPGGADALVRARVNQSDVLTNHSINAGKYADCRAQLTALIDWHEGRSATGSGADGPRRSAGR